MKKDLNSGGGHSKPLEGYTCNFEKTRYNSDIEQHCCEGCMDNNVTCHSEVLAKESRQMHNFRFRVGMTMSRNFGFTLAEVLITLAVIGVVAAITMPVLWKNIRNNELEARFKKANTTVAQAIKLMENDLGGESVNTVYCAESDNAKGFLSDFSKYFSNPDVGLNYTRVNLGYKASWLSASNRYFNVYNGAGGAMQVASSNINIFNGNCDAYGVSNPKVNFLVDTNGLKGPNRFGYDLFIYVLRDNNTLGSGKDGYNASEERAKLFCNFTASESEDFNTNGIACKTFAERNINPKDNTKSYWKSLP